MLRRSRVYVLVDACGGLSPRTEEAAFSRIESFDANTAATTTLGTVLAQDLSSAKGAQLIKIPGPIMG